MQMISVYQTLCAIRLSAYCVGASSGSSGPRQKCARTSCCGPMDGALSPRLQKPWGRGAPHQVVLPGPPGSAGVSTGMGSPPAE